MATTNEFFGAATQSMPPQLSSLKTTDAREDISFYATAQGVTKHEEQNTDNSSDTEPDTSPFDLVDYDEERELNDFVTSYGLGSESGGEHSHKEDSDESDTNGMTTRSRAHRKRDEKHSTEKAGKRHRGRGGKGRSRTRGELHTRGEAEEEVHPQTPVLAPQTPSQVLTPLQPLKTQIQTKLPTSPLSSQSQTKIQATPNHSNAEEPLSSVSTKQIKTEPTLSEATPPPPPPPPQQQSQTFVLKSDTLQQSPSVTAGPAQPLKANKTLSAQVVKQLPPLTPQLVVSQNRGIQLSPTQPNIACLPQQQYQMVPPLLRPMMSQATPNAKTQIDPLTLQAKNSQPLQQTQQLNPFINQKFIQQQQMQPLGTHQMPNVQTKVSSTIQPLPNFVQTQQLQNVKSQLPSGTEPINGQLPQQVNPEIKEVQPQQTAPKLNTQQPGHQEPLGPQNTQTQVIETVKTPQPSTLTSALPPPQQINRETTISLSPSQQLRQTIKPAQASFAPLQQLQPDGMVLPQPNSIISAQQLQSMSKQNSQPPQQVMQPGTNLKTNQSLMQLNSLNQESAFDFKKQISTFKYRLELQKKLQQQQELIASRLTGVKIYSTNKQEGTLTNIAQAGPKGNTTTNCVIAKDAEVNTTTYKKDALAEQKKLLLEKFPYFGPTPDYNNIERFISRRTCIDSKKRGKVQYYEYLVKFSNFSYRQCKWHTKSFLESKLGGRSISQLRTFETKWEKNLWKGTTEECVVDIHKEKEKYDESITEFLTPESILYCVENAREFFGKPSLPAGRVYLVKWYGVKLLDSTWETEESLCNKQLTRTFDEFIKKSPWKKEENMFKRMKKYQKFGITWAYESYAKYGRNVIIGDDFGLGKRAQSLFTLVEISNYIKGGSEKLPTKPIFLIVSQFENLRGWQEDIQFYTLFKPVIYAGTIDERNIIEELLLNKNIDGSYDFDVLLTTYEACMADNILEREAYPWKYVIFDDAQKLRAGRNNKYFFSVRPKNFMLNISNPLIEESKPKVDPTTLDEGVEDVIDSDSISLDIDESNKDSLLDLWDFLTFVGQNEYRNYDSFIKASPDEKRAFIKKYYLRRRRVYEQPVMEAPGLITLGHPTKGEQISIHTKAILPQVTPLQKVFLKRTYMKNIRYLKRRKEPLSSLMLVVEDVENCLVHPKLKQNNDNAEEYDFDDSDSSDDDSDDSDTESRDANKEARHTQSKSKKHRKSFTEDELSKRAAKIDRKRTKKRELMEKEMEIKEAVLQRNSGNCALSGKLLLLKHLLPKLIEKGHRVLFLSNSLEELDVLQDELITKTLGTKFAHPNKVISEILDGNVIEREIIKAARNESYVMLASMNLGLLWIVFLLNFFDDFIFLDIGTVENRPLENELENLIQVVPPAECSRSEGISKSIYYLFARGSFESMYFREKCFTNDRYTHPNSQRAWVDKLMKCGTSPFFAVEPAGAQVMADFKSVNGIKIDDPEFWSKAFKGSDKESFPSMITAAEKEDLDKIVDYDLIKRVAGDAKEIKHKIARSELKREQTRLPSLNPVQTKDIIMKEPLNSVQTKDVTMKDALNPVQTKDVTMKEPLNSVQPKDVIMKEPLNPVQTKDVIMKEPTKVKEALPSIQSRTDEMEVEGDAKDTPVDMLPLAKKVKIEDNPSAVAASREMATNNRLEMEWTITEIKAIIQGLELFGWNSWDVLRVTNLQRRTTDNIERVSHTIISEMLNEVPLSMALVFVMKIFGFRLNIPPNFSGPRPFRPKLLWCPKSLNNGGTVIGLAYSTIKANRIDSDVFFEVDPVFHSDEFTRIKRASVKSLKAISLATETRHLANAVRSGYTIRRPKVCCLPQWWQKTEDVNLLRGIHMWGLSANSFDIIFKDETLIFKKLFRKTKPGVKGPKHVPSSTDVMTHVRMLLNANRAWVLPIVSAIDNAGVVAKNVEQHPGLAQVIKIVWSRGAPGLPKWWSHVNDMKIISKFAGLRGATLRYLNADPACMQSGMWYDNVKELEDMFRASILMPTPPIAASSDCSTSTESASEKTRMVKTRDIVNRFFDIYNVFEELKYIDYIFPIRPSPQGAPQPQPGKQAEAAQNESGDFLNNDGNYGKFLAEKGVTPLCSDVGLAKLNENRPSGTEKDLVADLSLLRFSFVKKSLLLPIAVEWGLEVEDLGMIVPSFSNENYIYPLNYRAIRVINSPEKDKNVPIKCECKIMGYTERDKEGKSRVKPLFKIAIEGTDAAFIGKTPDEVCVSFFTYFGYSENVVPRNYGEKFIGLDNPLVVHVIQSSPRAALCPSYKHRHIKLIESIKIV